MRIAALVCAGAALVGSFAGSASAQTGQAGDLAVTGVGNLGWKLDCSLKLAGGKDASAAMSGKRGEVKHLTKLNVASGSCAFTGPTGGLLELQFDTKDFTCPFPNAGPESCKRSVKAGEKGEFALSLRH